MIHPTDSPLGIDVWYPVLRGGEAPVATFTTADARVSEHARDASEELENGQRLVLLASPARTGGRSELGALEGAVAGEGSFERFVVFPGTGGSFTLLSTEDSAALRGGIPLLPSGRLRGRAVWTLLRSLSPFGVAQRLGRPEVSVWTKGPSRREEDDLAILPVDGTLAIAAGVPDRNQKIIARALDRRGAARAIVKMGRSERTDDAVDREAQALETVADLLPGRSPRLLARGERAGRTWLAQEVVQGRHAGEILTPQHAEFLLELGRASRSSQPLEETQAYADATRHLTNLKPDFDPDWHSEYERLRGALEDTADGAELPATAAHGDFTPWNVRATRAGIRAFDWEYFSPSAPALYDLVHFHVQSCVLVRQFPGERIFDSFDAFFRGPAGEVARGLDLEASDVVRALGLYVLHEGTSAEVLERLRPAPFVQASWLRRARLELCHRIAGLLIERRIPAWADRAARDRRSAA